jgi:hypothetical protein
MPLAREGTVAGVGDLIPGPAQRREPRVYKGNAATLTNRWRYRVQATQENGALVVTAFGRGLMMTTPVGC